MRFDLMVFLLFLPCLDAETIYYDEYDEYNAPEEPEPQEFISGGFKPPRDYYIKYMVSIRTSSPTQFFGDNHFCSGTIIARSLVATAAHCVMDARRTLTRARRLRVVAGTPNRLIRSGNTLVLKVSTVIVHPEYIRNGAHDLALLFLTEAIPIFNNQIKILPMIRRPVVEGTRCLTLGWGQIYNRGPYVAKAVYASLTILSHKTCSDTFGSAYDESMLCADDFHDSETGACPGDSGGPLICKGKLAGIISWGSHCGNTYNPVLFTNIYHHRGWLREVNAANVCSISNNILQYFILYCIYFSVVPYV